LICNLKIKTYALCPPFKYMRVPEWAVVDKAVNLERFDRGKRALAI